MTLDSPSLDSRSLDRHLPFSTVSNFRDLGGYPAAGGRSVRWRTVFRADGLNRLGSDDLARLGDLGVRTVLDLRTLVELEERGRIGTSPELSIGYHHLPVIATTWDRVAWDELPDGPRFLADRYLDMVEEGGVALGRALHILADPRSLPLVFHCAAGKDRTGVLAALTLSVLGVADDVIAHDYGLSRLSSAALAQQWRARSSEGADAMDDWPPAFLDSPDEAMRLFLDGLRDRYGSTADYAASVGVDIVAIEALRAHLLD